MSYDTRCSKCRYLEDTIIIITQSIPPLSIILLLQTEMLYKKNPKLLNQFQYSEREGVPLLVIVGEEETTKGGVKIRDTYTRKEVIFNYCLSSLSRVGLSCVPVV